MAKNVDFYLSKGFDLKTATYFANGRKTIVAVTAQPDFSLLLTFDNGEIRRLETKDFAKEGTVFSPLQQWDTFSRVYLDSDKSVCWDIDPTIDSEKVWSNKIDLSPDGCYLDSTSVNDHK